MKVALLSVVLFLTGCVSFDVPVDVTIKVIDGETNMPLEQARVSINYDNMFHINPPDHQYLKTNDQGAVTMPIAGDFGGQFKVSAKGYNTVRAWVQRGRDDPDSPEYYVSQLHSRGKFICNHREWVVPLYRKPNPIIELVLPTGYRGPVVVDNVPIDSMTQGQPGQRLFAFEVNDRGYVKIEASPMLFNTDVRKSYRATYADGTTIPLQQEVSDNRVALAWFDRVDRTTYFVVGNRDDSSEFKSQLRSYDGRGMDEPIDMRAYRWYRKSVIPDE